MFKNAFVYHIEPGDLPAQPEIERRLAAAPFVECGATQPESAGWVGGRASNLSGKTECRLLAERGGPAGSST